MGYELMEAHDLEPFDLDFQPGMLLREAIGHYTIGILIHAYPTKGDHKLFVDPTALERLGGKLGQTVANIYNDVITTGRTLTARITWTIDGVPEVNIIKAGKIIIPEFE